MLLTQPASEARAPRTPFRVRQSPRSPVADQKQGFQGWGEVRVRDLASPVVQQLKLSTFKVWVCMCAEARKKREYRIQIGYGTLAALANLNRRTVRNAVIELQQVGLIDTSRNWGFARGWSRPGDLANTYQILRPSESVAAAELAPHLRGLDPATRPRTREEEELAADLEALEDYAGDLGPDQAEQKRLELEQRQAELDRAHQARLRDLGLVLRLALDTAERQLIAAEGALGSLPAIPAPLGAARFQNAVAAQDAFRARGAQRDARIAVLDARVIVGALQVRIQEDAPDTRWTDVVAQSRLALSQAEVAAQLYDRAKLWTEAAVKSWLPLIPEEVPMCKPSTQWEPPGSWRPKLHNTPETWRNQRKLWKMAEQQGVYKILAGLREQGFDPDWPDPPSTGPPNSGRRQG